MHEWGYTFHSMYDLTAREFEILQLGFATLMHARHPEGAERSQHLSKKEQIKRGSKKRARQKFAESRNLN